MARRPRRTEGEERPPTINPYVDWAWGPGRPYYFRPGLQPEREQRMTLLLQLKGITAQDFIEGGSVIDGDSDRVEWQSSFRELFAGLRPEPKPDEVSWVLGMVTERVSDIIASEKARRFVQSVILGRPLGTQSLPPRPRETERRKPVTPRRAARRQYDKPPAVVVGVVDDGICFANERFRNRYGTRVEQWWLMDGPTNNPLGGHVLDKAAIDLFLGQCTNANGALNEDLFYRLVQLIDFRQPNHKSAAWQASHGTHVMDLACGFDPAVDCDDRPIVCVQLPTRVTAEVDNGHLLPYFVAAADFIVSSALQIAADRNVPPLPVVINFSYGRYEGPHDGTHPIELFIDWLVALCAPFFDLRVILPAGNSFLSRTHAQFSFQSALAETQTVPWRILPDDRTESFVEIWLPPSTVGGGSFSVTLTTPTNQAFSINETQTLVFLPFGLLAYLNLSTTRRVFFVILAPTSDFNPAATLAPGGTYSIAIARTSNSTVVEVVHAWVARDETLPGYPQAGRQSFFNDPAYQRFDYAGGDLETDDTATSVVKRRGTINSIATGDRTIVMGGYLRKEMVMAKYSAAATRQPPPRWPDAATPSDDSRVHQGVLAAGSRSNSVFAMAGTSVAAPQIARMVADDLAAGQPGDRARVQYWATQAELGYPAGTPPTPASERVGSGRIPTIPIVPLNRYEWP
jgi:hypothetical protein